MSIFRIKNTELKTTLTLSKGGDANTFAASIGKKTLAFALKMTIDNISHHGTKDGITEKL